MRKKKQEQNLIQQFYSRLNITWEQKPKNGNKNPILQRTEQNLMSKSIAHRFFNSKRYKLSQQSSVQKKESKHVFTNTGIIKRGASHDLSEEKVSNIDSKQNNSIKFERYYNSELSRITVDEPHESKWCKRVIQFPKRSQVDLSNKPVYKIQNNKQTKNKSLRTMSAHLTHRKPFKITHENYSFRKTVDSWEKKGPSKTMREEKEQLKGWQIEDCLDINFVELRTRTEY